MIVFCSTTKGDVYLKIHPEWSPIGADRFLNLVESGHFDDSAFYRVVPGFVTQFGISADSEASKQMAKQVRRGFAKLFISRYVFPVPTVWPGFWVR